MYTDAYVVNANGKGIFGVIVALDVVIAIILLFTVSTKPSNPGDWILVCVICFFCGSFSLFFHYLYHTEYLKVAVPQYKYIAKKPFKKRKRFTVDEIGNVKILVNLEKTKMLGLRIYNYKQELLCEVGSNWTNWNLFYEEMIDLRKVRPCIVEDLPDEVIEYEDAKDNPQDIERMTEEEKIAHPEIYNDGRKTTVRIFKVASLVLSFALIYWIYLSPGLKSMAIRFIVFWAINLSLDFIFRNMFIIDGEKEKKELSSYYMSYDYRLFPYVIVLLGFEYCGQFKFEGGYNTYIYFAIPFVIMLIPCIAVVLERRGWLVRITAAGVLLAGITAISYKVCNYYPLICTETISEETCRYVDSREASGKITTYYVTVKDSNGDNYEFRVKKPTYDAISEKKVVPVICHHVDKHGVKICHIKYYKKDSEKIENKAVLKKIDKIDCKK